MILTNERNGLSVEGVCNSIHRDFVKEFKFCNFWGSSVKHCPQRVGLSHHLEDDDVIQIFKKS